MPTVEWHPEKMNFGRCNIVTFSDPSIPLRAKLVAGLNTVTAEQLKMIQNSPMYSRYTAEKSLIIPKSAAPPSSPATSKPKNP